MLLVANAAHSNANDKSNNNNDQDLISDDANDLEEVVDEHDPTEQYKNLDSRRIQRKPV